MHNIESNESTEPIRRNVKTVLTMTEDLMNEMMDELDCESTSLALKLSQVFQLKRTSCYIYYITYCYHCH